MPDNAPSQQQVIDSLPAHLQPFVATQDYSQYTPRDHAVWRFLLHQLRSNLADSAQPTYLEGLQRTGITAEAIPRIEDINACLSHIGWRAVVVDGFLPPAIFMEFQAIKVLVIAVNMRSFEHMLYTPAPDIVHESAGHAPFLIDIDYAEFLQRFGELGMQALSNQEDMEVYEAVRNLSIVKETADATEQQITAAQDRLESALQADAQPSEAALLARLHWWTVEYGLVGNLNDYAIFGAGLLSSLGESQSCLNDEHVKKIPLTVNSIKTAYDITAQQPQLFVTESCRHLSQILEEFGRKMACASGGTSALQKALEAGTVCTIETNAGLQIAGKVSNVIKDAVGNAIYFNTDGPTQLAYQDTELDGQGTAQHPHGFGSPLGRLVGFERCLSSYTVDELKRHHLTLGESTELRYLSGIRVVGRLCGIHRRQQKNILLTFEQCTVTDIDGNVLFDPSWGVFDMAVGDSVVSVKGGSADKSRFALYAAPSSKTTNAQKYDAATEAQFTLYQKARDLRVQLSNGGTITDELAGLVADIKNTANADWLLIYECLELMQLSDYSGASVTDMRHQLEQVKRSADADTVTLIDYALARCTASAS